MERFSFPLKEQIVRAPAAGPGDRPRIRLPAAGQRPRGGQGGHVRPGRHPAGGSGAGLCGRLAGGAGTGGVFPRRLRGRCAQAGGGEFLPGCRCVRNRRRRGRRRGVCRPGGTPDAADGYFPADEFHARLHAGPLPDPHRRHGNAAFQGGRPGVAGADCQDRQFLFHGAMRVSRAGHPRGVPPRLAGPPSRRPRDRHQRRLA